MEIEWESKEKMRKNKRKCKSSFQEIELLQSYNLSKLKFLHHSNFAKIVCQFWKVNWDLVPYVQTNPKCKLAASVQMLPEFFSGRYKSYSVNSLLPALCFVLKSSWSGGQWPLLEIHNIHTVYRTETIPYFC